MATASDGLGIYADDANVANARVSVTTHVNKYGNGIATVPRDEFLDAVARELDVIITPRSDLPEVTSTYAGGLRAIHGPTGSEATIRAGDAAADVHSLALCYLAIAEHLENNTPIDEAAVDDLANVIRDTNLGHRLTMGDVRALVRAGVRVDGAK